MSEVSFNIAELGIQLVKIYQNLRQSLPQARKEIVNAEAVLTNLEENEEAFDELKQFADSLKGYSYGQLLNDRAFANQFAVSVNSILNSELAGTMPELEEELNEKPLPEVEESEGEED